MVAPYTIAPQLDIAGAAARNFTGTLFGRLDAYRDPNTAGLTRGTPVAGGPVSVFIQAPTLASARATRGARPASTPTTAP